MSNLFLLVISLPSCVEASAEALPGNVLVHFLDPLYLPLLILLHLLLVLLFLHSHLVLVLPSQPILLLLLERVQLRVLKQTLHLFVVILVQTMFIRQMTCISLGHHLCYFLSHNALHVFLHLDRRGPPSLGAPERHFVMMFSQEAFQVHILRPAQLGCFLGRNLDRRLHNGIGYYELTIHFVTDILV